MGNSYEVSLSDLMLDEAVFSSINEFAQIQQIYSAAIKEIKTKLEILDDEFAVRYDYNPIHHMDYRLKKPRSIINKCRKNNIPVNADAIQKNLFDIAGIRVICNYVDDIYLVANLLSKQDDVTLLVKKDYIKNPKPSGYRSLHLVLEIPIFLADETKMVPVEIQIRTIAMDFWASLEHHMKYKTDASVPDGVRLELTECANSISKLDHKMQGIHNELTKLSKKDD
ncbi:GTP pyrophosphokinase [Tannockella kyphosi]|uniref:GTP pyrophosphokinase n=1 Tax=Tannockella kyphosi TaxID=2899121 RepID=UPI002012C253|nr:GTP pyrophosphokinase family protein [Tannockella kyphosi]